MNIDNITTTGDVPETFLGVIQAIFVRQTELMAKYKEIEKLPAAPVSLHTPAGQRVIKDFMWRATEELAESYEAALKHDDFSVGRRHSLEEAADAVHFMVEMLIFAGITPEQCCEKITKITPMKDADTVEYYWYVTYKMGLAANFLRNKAWKVSHVPTDEARFRAAAISSFEALIDLWGALGCTDVDLYTFYFKKADVNSFRQRSKY